MILRAFFLSIMGILILVGFFSLAKADPIAAAEQGGVRITVYTEKCELKEVANLSNRATWTENGKTIEGCAGVFPQAGLVMFYFADRTVVPAPMHIFEKVIGA